MPIRKERGQRSCSLRWPFLLWQNWDCAVLRGAIFSLRPPVAISFAVRFLPTSLLNQRPPGAPSFAVRFLPTSLLNRRPPGTISCFLRFHLPLYFTRDLRWPHLSLFEERSGRKTNQRAPKPPFGFWLFIRGFGGETCVGPTSSHWCN